jgi:hypothetical protein
MNEYELEREHDLFYAHSTTTDAIREYAWNAGSDNPDRPWILTDWDVWMPNPHFVGDRGPHPLD